eukprot:6920549-Prymnesium_polylepis.1
MLAVVVTALAFSQPAPRLRCHKHTFCHKPWQPEPRRSAAILLQASSQTDNTDPTGELALRLTAFSFVLGLSLTTLTPAPHLVSELGQVQGVKLLTALATTSAATEIAISPVIGGLSDSLGRKPVLVSTLASALLASACVAVAPCVGTVALA